MLLAVSLAALLYVTAWAFPPHGGVATPSGGTDLFASCLAAEPVNTWFDVSLCPSAGANQTLSVVAWSGGNVPNDPITIANYMGEWSGGAWDNNEGYFLIWGAGHTVAAGYGGNEVYAYDFPHLIFKRLSDPDQGFTTTQVDTQNWLSTNGAPTACHSYYLLEFLPASDQFFNMCRGGTNSGSVNNTAQTFLAVVTGLAQGSASGYTMLGVPSYSGSFTGNDVGLSYDPTTGHIFMAGTALFGVYEYAPSGASGSWAGPFSNSQTNNYQMGWATQPGVELLATGGNGVLNDLETMNITSSGKGTRTTLTASGSTVITSSNGPSLTWFPQGNQYVGWTTLNNDGNNGACGTESGDNRTLYTITASGSTRTVAATTGTQNGTHPCNAKANGTYGRFRYLGPKYNAFCLVNEVNQHVLCFKPPASGAIT